MIKIFDPKWHLYELELLKNEPERSNLIIFSILPRQSFSWSWAGMKWPFAYSGSCGPGSSGVDQGSAEEKDGFLQGKNQL